MNLKTLLPNRRWFRFSLRTMFAVIAVFACWLAYSYNWIHQRHEALKSVKTPPLVVLQNGVVVEQPPPWPLPLSLRILGERGNTIIALPGKTADAGNKARVETLSRLFPEAYVTCDDDVPDDSL